MSTTWTIILSEEVAEWIEGLSPVATMTVGVMMDRLRMQGNLLGMPHSKALGDGLYELRFSLQGTARRITYTYEPGRRVITLTTFRKQRQNERREVIRARRAKKKHDDTRGQG